MTTITEPCYVPDMPDDVYHADPCPEPSLSSSIAKLLLTAGGPARVNYRRQAGPEVKRAFDYGHAAHAKALGRGTGVAVYPDEWLTKSGYLTTSKRATAPDGDRTLQDDISDWETEQRAAGLAPLTPKDAAQIDAMAEAILANPFAADLLTAGQGIPELSMFTIDERTGRWLRGRLDLHLGDLLAVDYKTTSRLADIDTYEQASWRFRYHIQYAHYHAIAEQLGILQPDAEMWFIAQETAPPYLVGVYRLNPDLLADGRAAVQKAITVWDRCLTTGEWPGLPQSVLTIGRPRWANPTQEEEE